MLTIPQRLIEMLRSQNEFDELAFTQVHQSGEQVTSIRMNPAKGIQHSTFNIQHKVPWSEYGFYLEERPSFTADPLFHAGAYYVQEASSMFLEEVLKQTVNLSQPLKVLDLCAAPGGKSTLIQSLISEKSLLVSNEVIKSRVNVLSENITKWGAANVIVTNNDPKDFQRLQNYFDVIVIDAPCSGSGLFRKDPEAINEWSEQNVQHCSQRQQRILTDIIPSLKNDGILIYSTCSYSQKEDEDIVDWIVKEYQLSNIRLIVKNEWGIIESQSCEQNSYGYRFYPDKVKGEGFYISAFRKNGCSENINELIKSKNKSEKLSAGEISVMSPYINEIDNFFFIKQNDEVIAIPKFFENDLSIIQSSLYIKKAGIKIGSIIRNELIPHHELALSMILQKNISAIETDRETALNYLRKQEIKIDSSVKGWVVLTYMQFFISKMQPSNKFSHLCKEKC
jgi:NOL1/NOP2/sun family putative RNA methylase